MKSEHIISPTIIELSDSEVLTRSQTEPRIFETLVERYQKEFLRKAYRITLDKDDAQDIVQDVFIKMYRFAHKFKHQDGATFKSWAYKILTNTCFTYCKRKRRRQQFFARADEEMLELFSSSSIEFEHKLDTNQIKVAITQIPDLLGRMVTLVLSGKSYQEIAKLERVSVGTIRTRLHRAKRAINKVIS